MLDVSAFRTRNALEGHSLRYANERKEFVADEIFTPVMVDNSQFKVYQYDTSNMRAVETQKDSKAEADLVDYGVFTRDRTAQLHKLAGEIDPADEKDFDAAVADISTDTAEVIMERLLIAREILSATLVETTGNYPSDLTATLSAGSTWLDAGGDPEGNAATARAAVKARTGRMPNAASLSWDSYEKLKAAPYFIDRMKYTNASVPDAAFQSMLKAWLNVEYIHIGGALKNTNVEGNATQTLANIWADGILFYVKNPSPAKRVVRYGAKYIRNQLYSYKYQVNERGSGDGRIQRLEMGWWYLLSPSCVVSSSDNDFTAGYYLDNIV
jgi:hypothetical protein